MSIFLQSDVDQSCSISEQEADILKLRLDTDPRVKVNGDNLREALKAHGGQMSIAVLVKDFYIDTPEEERIFTVVEEEIVKSG